MQWAMTQNNLGTALKTLGERGDDDALKGAVTAYRAALEVYTREAAPMQWAITMYNLAGVLAHTGAFDDAEDAANGALEVFRDAAPAYANHAEKRLAEIRATRAG